MPCVAVTGLTDWEMPEESFFVMKVEGLCIGSSGVNNKNKRVGYVLYCKRKLNAKMEIFAWIIQNIFTQFVQDQWLVMMQKKMVLFQFRVFVSDCDGDYSQLKAILANIDHFSANDIIATKHNASR